MFMVEVFSTESAAYLASARIAANGGPMTVVFQSFNHNEWLVFTDSPRNVEPAKKILAMFS